MPKEKKVVLSKLRKFVLLLLISSSLVVSFVVPVSALDSSADYYYVTSPISQPTCSDNFGYIEIVCQDQTTWQRYGYVFLISFSGNTKNPTCGIKFTHVGNTHTNIRFTNISDGMMQYVRITESGGVYSSSLFVENQEAFESNYLKVVSAKAYGCCYIWPQSENANTVPFVTVYGSDRKNIELLESIQGLMGRIDNITTNQDKNTDKITSNNNSNTDKIINNQNQLQEQEKNETQNQGNNSINDVSGVIEDKSSGFISSINGLVSSMSYSGTSCSWSFPALKLPAIKGVMSEIQLTEEQPIDFEFWVNKIPSNILILIRSLLTIALIGYCFKELYSTISYVLTLKGGGNDE